MTQLLAGDDLRCRIDSCPLGAVGWAEYERLCRDVLSYLFVPPLQPPRIQARTLSGTERRDAVFADRQRDTASNWGLLYADHDARMILVEFKNYDCSDIGPEEVAETSSHLRNAWGRLAIMCCSKQPTPTPAAHRRQAQYDLQRRPEAHLVPDVTPGSSGHQTMTSQSSCPWTGQFSAGRSSVA